MKTVCIYHNKDVDNFMSAAIVKYWFNETQPKEDTIDFIAFNYWMPFPDLTEYDKVISLNCYFIYYKHNNNVTYLTNKYSYEKSLSNLVWKTLFQKEPLKFFKIAIKDISYYATYDIQGARVCIVDLDSAYQWLLDELYFQDAIDDTLISPLVKIEQYGRNSYESEYKNHRIAYNNGIEKVFSYKYVDETINKKFLCVNKYKFSPDHFYTDYSRKYDGIASFWMEKGEWIFNLYSKDCHANCSLIAKEYGGDGELEYAEFKVKDISKIL